MKKTVWHIIDKHATAAALAGQGPHGCPYKHKHFKTRWLRIYTQTRQTDWIGKQP